MFYSNTITEKRKPRYAGAFAAALALSSAALINPAAVHAAATYKSLHDFWAHPSGADPVGGFVKAADGTMYGTTFHGGQFGFGTIFSVTTDGKFHTLYSFKGGNGPVLVAGFSIGPDGSLYGVSESGGANNNGTLFKFDPAASTLTVLHSFSGLSYYDGLFLPVVAKDGSVFGCYQGYAGIDSFTYHWTAASGLKVLQNYATTLVAGTDGYIYGASRSMLFKMSSNGVMIKLHDSIDTDGTAEAQVLALGPGGVLWGASANGGPNGRGSIFKIKTNGQGFTVVHNNTATEPSVGLAAAVGTDNKFYSFGTDIRGANGGWFFSVGTDGVVKIILDRTGPGFFSGPSFGPDGRLWAEQDYRTGDAPAGSLFKMTTAGAVTPIRKFETTDLAGPASAPIKLASGDYFGTGFSGGAFNSGGIYRLTPLSKLTIQYNFLLQGPSFASAFTLGSDGNAYTLGGGQFLKLTADGSVSATDISAPEADLRSLAQHPLTLGSDGRLFGIGDHAIYTLGYDGAATKLRDTPPYFNPYEMVLAGDGNFYAPLGDTANGYLFASRVTPSETVVKVHYATGLPQSSVAAAFSKGPDGSIYGSALGSKSFIFQLNVKTSKLTRLYTFPADSAWLPSAGKVVVRADGTIFGTVNGSMPAPALPKSAVYSISPSGEFSIVTELHNPVSATIAVAADLALDGDHAIIGVASGGTHGDGEVFRIAGI